MSRLAPRPATHLATPARSVVISAALLVLLSVGSTGCNTRAVRPDAEVARLVEQEERRLSHSGAIASVDLETFDLSSVGMAIEAMALVMVGGDPSRAAPPPTASAPIGAAEGWHYEAPSAWGANPWSLAASEPDGLGASKLAKHPQHRSESAIAIEDGGEDGRGGGKPRLRFNLLRLRVKEHPVSFSGSMKGTKGMQLKATIKM